MSARAFPAIGDAEWEAVARQWFEERDGRPAAGYDPKLAETLAFDAPLPVLWPQFQALARIPALAIRGANSDILSSTTLQEMTRRHPNLETLTVPEQGHAPLLHDSATIGTIYEFLARADAAAEDIGEIRALAG